MGAIQKYTRRTKGGREILFQEQFAAVHHGLHETEDGDVAVQAEKTAQVGDFAVMGQPEVVQRLFERQVGFHAEAAEDA